jgi:glyoxylase-like metal-dependent hydrolase (beta-lactamase superfamily II)
MNMVQEIYNGIYLIEIPIPNNPLKALNSYVILSPDKTLIIDTGLNRPECIAAMRQGLAELDVDPGNAFFLITHMHADHSGAVGELTGPDSTVYASSIDAAIINSMGRSMEHWNTMKEYARRCGFPAAELEQAIERHPGFKYGNKREIPFAILKEGDILNIGGYSFRCIETPGHTRGHICLYDSGEKLLFSGDHILNSITPNISSWSDEENPLAVYLASLDKIARLPVAFFFPSHRRPGANCAERIAELKEHHHLRSGDVLEILANGPVSAYEVASRMRWDLTYASWEQFPAAQKWFATGEAVAHLQYLVSVGKAEKRVENGWIRYTGR